MTARWLIDIRSKYPVAKKTAFNYHNLMETALQHQYKALAVEAAKKCLDYVLFTCMLGEDNNPEHSRFPEQDTMWMAAITIIKSAATAATNITAPALPLTSTHASSDTSQIRVAPQCANTADKTDASTHWNAAENMTVHLGADVPLWEDLILDQSTRDQFDMKLMIRLKMPSHHINPYIGALLYGPPGTGKTLMCKSIAKSSNYRFFHLDLASLLSQWQGELEK